MVHKRNIRQFRRTENVGLVLGVFDGYGSVIINFLELCV